MGLRGECARALRPGAAASLILTFGIVPLDVAGVANDGGVIESSDDPWNDSAELNGNVDFGESIGPLRMRPGAHLALRAAWKCFPLADGVDRASCGRNRYPRDHESSSGVWILRRVAEAQLSARRASALRDKGDLPWRCHSLRLKTPVRSRRCSPKARVGAGAHCVYILESLRRARQIGGGSRGPIEPIGLRLPLPPILRRHRAVASASLLRDPSARVRNLPATSGSTPEGTETVLFFGACVSTLQSSRTF
jgi:hypothetical protein